MKQLSHLLTLLFLLFYVNSKAQTDIQQDWRVDPLLKQVDAKRPGLTMFSRKDDRGKYVNMAVLVDSTRMLTWFTCHGQAFDLVRLPDDIYSKIKSGDLNPFNYYKDYFFDLLSYIRDAVAQFRQKGQAVLKDTSSIYHRIYTYRPVQHARSTLQKEVAIERVMSDLCLRLSLFDSRTPRQLHPSDSFQLRLQLAGKMVRKGDTTTYYNANPLSSASRIVLSKQVPGKMFVYDRQGQLADSVPLKTGKYTALLNEKEDVFLLYRGWLELQSQQAIAGKEEVARLLDREYTMLYKPANWSQHKQQLQQTLSEVQEQVDAVGNKVMELIVPAPEETEHLLAAVYQDKPAEVSYMRGLGFAYTIAYMRGHKQYELTDHRGNVMAVVSDKKKGVDENADGAIEYYNADVVTAVDYFPFGSQMSGRTYNGGDKYRYGFNGKENDNEVKGEGNQYDYGFRIYDPRIGKFLSVDPLQKEYPDLTPYQFTGNSPIAGVDLDGREFGWFVTEYLEKRIWGTAKLSTFRKEFTEGVVQSAKETIVGFTNIQEQIKDQLHIKDFGRTTIADPGIAEREANRQIMKPIITGAALAQHYGELLDKAGQGDARAMGMLGFEVTMFLTPGGEEAAAMKTGAREANAMKAGASAEMIALDANALIGALERGEKNEIVAAIGADQPIVPITAAKEYLAKGDINLLKDFLKEIGAKIAPTSGTEIKVQELMNEAQAMGRSLKTKDARVAATAEANAAAVLTRDKKFFNFMKAADKKVKTY